MLLKNLIEKIPYNLEGLNIKGLASNSKDVKKGYIFFAIKGNNLNGENFINEAIKNGASVIISSKDYKKNEKKAIHIKVGNVRKSLSLICSKFFNSKPRNIIAVTGTNGKTSVADFFYQILKLNNIHVASIGTLGIKLDKKTLNTKLTSPDVITLHKNLEILKKNKIENVIIEASSHGLDQNRLNNLNFKAGIFTNLSQDHLDYHKTMRAYLESKMVLFKALLPKKSFVITDGKLKEFSILKKISKKKKLRLIDINKENVILKPVVRIILLNHFNIKIY
jgi:UDP-N-acetylmuramyl tripeptide synthase